MRGLQQAVSCIFAATALFFIPLAVCATESCEDRTFAPGVDYRVGPPVVVEPPAPHVLLALDFDLDGRVDLLALNRGTSTVSFLRGNGDGTFGEPEFFKVTLQARSLLEGLAGGDLNGDGAPDLVAADWNLSQFIVLFNDGAGGIARRQVYTLPPGSHPHSAVIVDVNADELADVVVVNDLGGSVSVWLNQGSGQLSLRGTVRCGVRTQSVAVGDFDRDGDPDLAAANAGLEEGAPPNVTILLNDGTGGFVLKEGELQVEPTSAPVSGRAEDLDGDGELDLVIGSWTDGRLYIFWGRGGGEFSPAAVLSTPGTAVEPVVADFDGDLQSDIAVSTFEEPWVVVFWNEGRRFFSDGPHLPTGLKPRYPAASDFDGDGDIDLASVQWGAGTASVFLNRSCRNRPFLRGDGNADGRLNMGDVLTCLGYLFGGAPPPRCLDSIDANDDGRANIGDALRMLGYLFGGEEPLPPPFPFCGTDPTPDSLGCAFGPDCSKR